MIVFLWNSSSLTLALMEDSGWYLANYTNSKMSPWGLGRGCAFINQLCLKVNDAGETVVPEFGKGYFCNQGAEKGCSSELTHKLACTVLDYNFYSPIVLPDEAYQYFPNEPSKGGPRQADFCPLFGTTYDNLKADQLDCANSANTPSVNVYRYADICHCRLVRSPSFIYSISFLIRRHIKSSVWGTKSMHYVNSWRGTLL